MRIYQCIERLNVTTNSPNSYHIKLTHTYTNNIARHCEPISIGLPQHISHNTVGPVAIMSSAVGSDPDPDDSSPSSSGSNSNSSSSVDEHGIGFPKGSESEFSGGSDGSLLSNDKTLTDLVRFYETINIY